MTKRRVFAGAVAAVTLLAVTVAGQGDATAQARRKTPPLQLPGYELPRPADVVRKSYQFAADHPDVLQYMPCFCGCDKSGHKNNADCFVTSRATNGDVTAWHEHGMVCAMCLAVCETSMQMHEAGKSLTETRAEVEKRYSGITTMRTPTPQPPAK